MLTAQPSERTLELALLTKQLLKKRQEWYENWKQRDEEMEKFFTPTKNAMQYQSRFQCDISYSNNHLLNSNIFF